MEAFYERSAWPMGRTDVDIRGEEWKTSRSPKVFRLRTGRYRNFDLVDIHDGDRGVNRLRVCPSKLHVWARLWSGAYTRRRNFRRKKISKAFPGPLC